MSEKKSMPRLNATDKGAGSVEDDTGDVYTIEEVAALLKVKPGRVKWLLRKGELRCKYISPRIRRITAKQYNEYVHGTNTWPIEASSRESSSKTGGSSSPPRSIPTGASAGTTPLPSRHEAFQLVQRMLLKDTSGG